MVRNVIPHVSAPLPLTNTRIGLRSSDPDTSAEGGAAGQGPMKDGFEKEEKTAALEQAI
jgi:hypothetical protein